MKIEKNDMVMAGRRFGGNAERAMALGNARLAIGCKTKKYAHIAKRRNC